MALALMLRNVAKTNYTGLTRKLTVSPCSKAFTTLVAGQTRNAAALKLASQPISLQLTKPVVRNIAVSAPRLSGSHGNHATLWKVERILAASLLAVLPAAFLTNSQVTDALLSVALVLHAHWGIEAIVIDYVRPSIFGAVIPKVSLAAVYVLSIAALAGLLNLVYNDIGVSQSIKKLWAVRYKEPEPETKGKK